MKEEREIFSGFDAPSRKNKSKLGLMHQQQVNVYVRGQDSRWPHDSERFAVTKVRV